jgi:hypothetical protein
MKSILKKKFNSWLESIEDDKVKSLVRKNTIITGGCITSMLLKEDIKDFDVYFRNKETTLAVANYYADEFNARFEGRKNKLDGNGKIFVIDGEVGLSEEVRKEFSNQQSRGNQLTHMLRDIAPDRVKIIIRSDGVASEDPNVLDHNETFEDPYDVMTDNGQAIDPVEALSDGDDIPAEALDLDDTQEPKKPYRAVFFSTNAITLADKVQVVVRFHGNPDQIHENYDFAHCMNYWTSWDEELILRPGALEATLAKELVYHGSKYPICSIIRTRKFLKRGWHINAGQYLKMCMQVSELDLKDIAVLEDQLVGVDSMYFMALIKALQEKIDADPEWTMDVNYVASIIDRIF